MVAAVSNHDNIKTLIVGLGSTGLAVARYLTAQAQEPLVIDSRPAPPGLAALKEAHPDIEVVLESLDPRWLRGIDRVVLSPGLSLDIPLVAEARKLGIPVLSDIELFAMACHAPVIAVTGSNGKSTVVTLAAQILRAQGYTAPAGGNLGPPAVDLLAETDADLYVLEVSSFQMETTESLRPLAGAVLNVSADHLDRHGSLERYAALKAKLLECASYAVFNWDDSVVRPMGLKHPRPIPFSTLEPLQSGFCIVEHDSEPWFARDLKPLMPVADLALAGAHSASNALAALALTGSLSGDCAAALKVLRSFRGLPHRCEWIAEHAGIAYINDSKGTNVGATVAALASIPGPIVLIGGGLSKGADFAPLSSMPRGKFRAAVLLGEGAPELEAVLTGICPTVRVKSMQEAVAQATQFAVAGDTVLLSPACASQDLFDDYRQRGEAFVTAVTELRR